MENQGGIWKVTDTFLLPEVAIFDDYSDIAITPQGHVAVVSPANKIITGVGHGFQL